MHISFVRSISMDKWKDSELEKMKAGGNRQANEFFASQPDFNPNMSLYQKYNSHAAALYRDKISTEAQGRSWSIQTANVTKFTENKSSNDDFGEFQESQTNDREAPSGLGSGNPKYWGFGNTNYDASAQKQTATPDLLAASLSNMSVNAAKWAGVAKDSMFKFSKTAADKATEISSKVTEQAKDGTLLNNVQSGVTNIASTMGKFGTKTWSDVQSLWSGKTSFPSNRDSQRLENNFDDTEQVTTSFYSRFS